MLSTCLFILFAYLVPDIQGILSSLSRCSSDLPDGVYQVGAFSSVKFTAENDTIHKEPVLIGKMGASSPLFPSYSGSTSSTVNTDIIDYIHNKGFFAKRHRPLPISNYPCYNTIHLNAYSYANACANMKACHDAYELISSGGLSKCFSIAIAS